MRKSNDKRHSPSLPYMPGYEMMFREGRKLLSWKWVIDRLSRAHNYYLSTVRPDGRPHVMPIWGVWIDRAFYFSTGRRSRKSKNLSLNPRCVVSLEDASRAVMLEGAAREITKGPTLEKFVIAYKKKYGWDTGETRDPVYQVSPDVIFGIAEDGRTNPTRWQFTAGP